MGHALEGRIVIITTTRVMMVTMAQARRTNLHCALTLLAAGCRRLPPCLPPIPALDRCFVPPIPALNRRVYLTLTTDCLCLAFVAAMR